MAGNHYPHQQGMVESQYTDQTQSYQVEQIITDQVKEVKLVPRKLIYPHTFTDSNQTSQGAAHPNSSSIRNRGSIGNSTNLSCTLSSTNWLCSFQLVFSIISAFFDGAHPYLPIVVSILFVMNACVLWYFLRYRHSRRMLVMWELLTSFPF